MDGLPSLGHKPGVLGEASKNHDHDDHGHNDDDEESGWMDYLHSDTSQVFLGRLQKIMIMMTMVIIPPKPKAKRLD